MVANIEPTEHQSAGAAAGSDDKFDKLDQQLRAIVEQQVGPHRNPLEEDEPVERDDLRPSITPYLDQETSERKAIYDRLRNAAHPTRFAAEIKRNKNR